MCFARCFMHGVDWFVEPHLILCPQNVLSKMKMKSDIFLMFWKYDRREYNVSAASTWLHHGVVDTDKELDLIEMAVYGNVIRPGLQCKCKSVAETLGTALYKSKGPEVSACELPYKATSFWQLQYLNSFILQSTPEPRLDLDLMIQLGRSRVFSISDLLPLQS